MSSDCFYVRVKSVDGQNVTFDVLTSTAGGFNDMCTSRSFALSLLSEALRRATDTVPGEYDDPAHEKEVARLYAKADGTAIAAALADQGDWYVSEEWMRANVAKYIASVTLVERRNNVGDEALRQREQAIQDSNGGALYTNQYWTWQPQRWAQCHNYTLDVVVTDPTWASHLEVGLEFGTTAFDVWYEARPPEPAAKKPAAKKQPVKKAAKKKPVKKAAKKKPVKKAAKKKPAKRR